MKISKLKCDICEKEFTATRYDAKFCSGTCKQKAYNRKLRQAIIKNRDINSIAEKQLNERLHKLEMQVDQKISESKIAPLPSNTSVLTGMNDFFAKMQQDEQNRKIEHANQRLKECLEKIMEYAQMKEIFHGRLQSLFNSIDRKLGTRIYTMPENYKYINFIHETLLPKIANLERGLKKQKERYSILELSESLEKQIRLILFELEFNEGPQKLEYN